MSAEPLVSLVIPVFNGERHLEACLRSLLAQSYEHFEIVISDQDSTDRSLELVATFADPRLRVLPRSVEPLNLQSNWTRAVDAAKGELVKIVCQDDLLLSPCLSVQVDLLNRHPTAALACGRRRIIDDHDKVLLARRGLGHLLKDGETKIISGPALARACTRAGSNLLGEPVSVLVRRSALPDPNFDPRWNYTIDLGFYMGCLRNDDAVIDSRVLSCFRVSPKQLSAQLAKTQARELREFLSEMAQRYPEQISKNDIKLGAARAEILSQGRQLLYKKMRFDAAVSHWRDQKMRRNLSGRNGESRLIQKVT